MSIKNILFFMLIGSSLAAMEKENASPQWPQQLQDIIAWTSSKRFAIGVTPRHFSNNNLAPFKMIVATILDLNAARLFYCDLTLNDFERATILLNEKIALLNGVALDKEQVLKAISYEQCAADDEIIGSQKKILPQPNDIYQDTLDQLLTWRHFCQRALCTHKWGPYCFSSEWCCDRTMLDHLFKRLLAETTPEQERALMRAIQARLPEIADAAQTFVEYNDLEEQLVNTREMEPLLMVQAHCEQRSRELAKDEVGVGEDMESLS